MDKRRINRFGIALTDAALDGNVSKVQGLLVQSTDYTYIQDVDYTTALHEVVRRIMENFIVNDPSRYTFQVVNKIKGYFRVARILRDHINISHERHCQTPVAHIILTERARWVLSEQVTITLLQAIATAQNINYLLYSKEQLIDRLCFEFVSHSLTSDNVNLVDREGNTALHLAVKIKQWDIVEELLKKGADKDVLNKHGFAAVTLMHFPKTATSETTGILKQLISRKTVNVRGLEGNTLLHRATFTQSYDKMKLLLGFGARVDIKNERGMLPMHVALQHLLGQASIFRNPDVLRLLLPTSSNLAIYEGINMIYGLASNGEDRTVLVTLVDHLDPSLPVNIEYNRNTWATRMELSSGPIGLVLKNTFGNLIGVVSLVMSTCTWIPRLPEFVHVEQAFDDDESFVRCRSIWRSYATERMKLTTMCSKVIYLALWRSRGDSAHLPLPNKLKEPFKHFADKAVEHALYQSHVRSPASAIAIQRTRDSST
jgi:hypothetical protein